MQKQLWRFKHRVTGKVVDVWGEYANDAMLENTAAFVVANGELPCWSQLDCWLATENIVNPGVRLVGYDRGQVEIREQRETLDGTGVA